MSIYFKKLFIISFIFSITSFFNIAISAENRGLFLSSNGNYLTAVSNIGEIPTRLFDGYDYEIVDGVMKKNQNSNRKLFFGGTNDSNVNISNNNSSSSLTSSPGNSGNSNGNNATPSLVTDATGSSDSITVIENSTVTSPGNSGNQSNNGKANGKNK